MKKLLFFYLLIASFASCTKDKDDDPPIVLGNFTIEGTTYDLHKGSIAYWGQSDDNTLYLYYFMLHTSGIYFENNSGFTGEGSAVSFFFSSSTYGGFSSTSSPIIPADSTFQPDQATYIRLNPVYPGDRYLCNSGNFSISVDDNEIFTITIEGVAESPDQTGEVPVSVYYKGCIEELTE